MCSLHKSSRKPMKLNSNIPARVREAPWKQPAATSISRCIGGKKVVVAGPCATYSKHATRSLHAAQDEFLYTVVRFRKLRGGSLF